MGRQYLHDANTKGTAMIDHENVRVEVVIRREKKDWAETGRYLSIRAYRNDYNNALLMGPDIPIHNDLSAEEIEQEVVQLLARLCGEHS